jgi:hypothetical protein
LDPFDPELKQVGDTQSPGKTATGIGLPVSLSLGEVTAPLAAFWPDAQRIQLPLQQIVNRGSAPLALRLDAHTSQQDIEVSFAEPGMAVSPEDTASTQVVLRMPPNLHAGRPIAITVRSRGADGPRLRCSA